MTGFFQTTQVKYHDKPVLCTLTFTEPARPIASAVLAAHQLMEQELLKFNPQADYLSNNTKANPVFVARAVESSLHKNSIQPINIMYDTNMNLEAVAITKDRKTNQHSHFEAIYRADSELLSEQFTHVTTNHLNSLKRALIAAIESFENEAKKRKNLTVNKLLKIDTKSELCHCVLNQTKDLIAGAKTVSAVISSIVVGADILAQHGLDDSSLLVRTVADLFKEDLPKVLGREIRSISIGSHLNHVGSAFQLEQARLSLMSKLETYLNSRARLDSSLVYADNSVSKTYSPIDRGIFYNKKLQQARIDVAAKLLMQLEHMQLETGEVINNPQYFAQALMNAIDANQKCHNDYGRIIDGTGELAGFLENMRLDMGEIYTQNVSCGSGKNSANLREQLGLEPEQTMAKTA